MRLVLDPVDSMITLMCISNTKCTGMEDDILDDSSTCRRARPLRSSNVLGYDLRH